MLPIKPKCATCGVCFSDSKAGIFSIGEAVTLLFCGDCINACGGFSEVEIVMVEGKSYLARKGEKRE